MYCHTSRASEALLGEFKAASRQFLRQGWQTVQEDISQIASGNQEMHPHAIAQRGIADIPQHHAVSGSFLGIHIGLILKKHVKKCDLQGLGSVKKTSCVMLSNRSHMVEQVCSTLARKATAEICEHAA